MLSALKKLISPPPFQAEAHTAYASLVGQSRAEFFYRDWQVSDTLDGRFDAIILHMFLVVHRLRKETAPEAALFARALQEAFFADMDRSVREMGVSDTGVGKRIKKMAQAFYGRMKAYEDALMHPDMLKETIARNLYRGAAPSEEALKAVASYMLRNLENLSAQNSEAITSGRVSFLN